MDWIQTFSGKSFRPRAPRPEDLDIHDIAHSLSLLCRFNGHCRTFYSVADHSIGVSRICSPEHALWGLLHDIGEAYLGDLPRPIKGFFPEFETYETNILQMAAGVFSLDWPMPPEVRVADDILLATEARDLMAPPPASWRLAQGPLEGTIDPLSPAEAERIFLERFHGLTDQATGHPALT